MEDFWFYWKAKKKKRISKFSKFIWTQSTYKMSSLKQVPISSKIAVFKNLENNIHTVIKWKIHIFFSLFATWIDGKMILNEFGVKEFNWLRSYLHRYDIWYFGTIFDQSTSQRARAILNKISNIINKIHTGLISVLQGFQKCIAWNPSN